MSDIAVIIPARHASSRFPGKPLVDILGRSLVMRTYDRAALAVGDINVFVATDSREIADHCRREGANVVMTSERCLTGTDRVAEAASQLEAQTIINVQGDEPLIEPQDILSVVRASRRFPDSVVNAMTPLDDETEFRDPSLPHVVVAPDGRLLYMSRAPIPMTKEGGFAGGMRQVCIYALPSRALKQFAACAEKSPLESVEDIEIVRFLELGVDVRMVEVSRASIAVDYPADVQRVADRIRSQADG